MARYRDLLDEIKLAFPQPTSNRIHDAYFSRLVQHALDQIDGLKGESPFLGRHGRVDYAAAQEQRLSEGMGKPEEVIAHVTGYLEGIPIWGHPDTQENVVPPTSIPSIVGMMGAAIYNPNVIWDAYSHRVAQAEVEAISMVAALVGYDPARAGGVFTFGGTGTNLYGVKLGLEKALPGTMQRGVRQDAAILCSDASHYSRLNVASWLGIGSENIVTVPTRRDNSMDPDAFAETLERLLADGWTVAAIIATLGTTDAFGIDPLEELIEARDRLAAKHGIDPPPHVHADAVIGWPWSVFNDYDFAANPLGFGPRTLRSLEASGERIRHLALADSIGVDFHKTGYAPYVSSLFLVKDRSDFRLLHRQQAEMPYLYQFGDYHPGFFTLECSRNGGSILAALANLKLLGKAGYRALLGHVVEMAERLREALEAIPSIAVVNDYNYGPVTLLRVYPPGTDAAAAYAADLSDPARRDAVRQTNQLVRQVFDVLHYDVITGKGVNLSLTDAYRKTDYGESVSALKSFIMSPFTDEGAVDLVVERVRAAQESLAD
jgi:glutamate/tyrosine decarboxylase-like PLP-dependent enzyme